MFQDRYTLAFKLYPYQRSSDQDAETPVRHPVVVMGGGPIGVATALDLGLQGVPVVVLDDHEGIGMGSRAICFAKRTLEIADRYGCGAPMLDKGVVWNLGKVFHRDRKIFEFNLLPEHGHKFPAFINLQQPYFERFLVDRLRAAQAEGAPIEIRGKNRVDAVEVRDDHVGLQVMTPDGPYKIEADWLIGCDGASSPLRTMLGYGFTGKVFRDSFLIADITMKADFPTERWFWFDPPHSRRCLDPAAQAARRDLAHRLPDRLGRRPQGGDAGGEHPPPARRNAGRGRVRDRLVLDLHLPVQADGALSARAGDLRRRRSAPGVALRRARREFGHAGRRQPRLEAGAGDRGQGTGEPARHLRRRAHPGEPTRTS